MQSKMRGLSSIQKNTLVSSTTRRSCIFFFRDSGTAQSRNPTLIATVGMLILGYGLSNLNGVRNRKEYEVGLGCYFIW